MAPAAAAFPKLNNCNYQTWKLDMEARLCTSAALHIVQGSETRPAFTTPLDASEQQELHNFEGRRDLAAGDIWGCVEREQQTHLEAIRDNPEAMWAKLESVHMQKRPGMCFNTYNALLSLSKGEDKSLTMLLTQASQLKSDMKALCPQDFNITKLNDELVLMALICALPAEYATLCQTLLLDYSLTLEKLQETFIARENQPGVSSTIPILSQVASAVLCGFCSHSGHAEEQCFSKGNASTKVKERAAQWTEFCTGKGKHEKKAKEASKEMKFALGRASARKRQRRH